MRYLFPFLIIFLVACSQTKPPEPYGPTPSRRQLKHHKMEFYGFIHFNMNTFIDQEWSDGSTDPDKFHPTNLDCEQWVKIAKKAGMKGLILTAKHHDGFCSWPSDYTDYSVESSNWRNGQGDVVRELADACQKHGLKMGLYLSPWDRNHPEYGNQKYITYYRNQLEELLTEYGPLFEVWFDGANGGDGYYGGANETRKIDRETYYGWEKTWKIVRDLQPEACIFSDTGPDLRWVGNEKGFAGKTNWCLLNRDKMYPGYPKYQQLQYGHEDGSHWVPAEVDVSIRPGWFYHASEDDEVKSVSDLLEIYYNSIGRNASFLLNLPVDDRGLVHPNDRDTLFKYAKALKKCFANQIEIGNNVQATNIRGNSNRFAAKNLFDSDFDTYWATDDNVKQASIIINFNEIQKFDQILLQEYISLGQRVQKFNIEARIKDDWKEITKGTTIGFKRILRFPKISTSQVRINIDESKACPVLSEIKLYKLPEKYELSAKK
ncbi:MAG TPA: alpha-L-fucosidase [bacterium]|nr:alpha-L-fucosidase [bacterium]